MEVDTEDIGLGQAVVKWRTQEEGRPDRAHGLNKGGGCSRQ